MPPEKEQAVLVQQTTQKKESNKKKSKDKKDKLFHDTKKFLQSYRRLELSLKYSKAMQTTRLAANDMSFEWELRDDEIEFNDMVLQEAISALHCLKQMPEMGRVWYHLLQMKYFDVRPYKMSDDAIITALQEAGLFSDISKTTFYRYQKSAIRMYGEILWGSLDKNSSVYKKFVKMIHSHDLEKQI